MISLFARALAMLFFFAAASFAAEHRPAEEAFSVVAGPTSGATVLEWKIEPGHYLYRNRIEATRAGAPLIVETPQGTEKDDLNFGLVEVYFGRAEALVPTDGGGPFDLTFQGCKDGSICYPPVTVSVDPQTFSVTSAAKSPDRPPSSQDRGFELAEGSGMVDGLLSKGGSAWVVASFFGFGLLLAFTPCVFPMYPILAGILTSEGGRLTARRGFALSSAYAVSLSAAFGLAGAAAGWSGANLQMALHSPYTAGVLALIFAVLAMSSFGFFHVRLPSSWTSAASKMNGQRRGSLVAAITVGFSSSLVVGPCVTAPLAGALVYIAQSADVSLGAAALFALGLGKSAPLVVLGTFGGGVLPRSGAWMETVNKTFGFAFLAAAAITLGPILPDGMELAILGSILIGMAVFLLFPRDRRKLLPVTGSGLLSAIAGFVLLAGGLAGSTDIFRPFAKATSASQASDLSFQMVTDTASMHDVLDGSRGSRPVMAYFTADWCTECRTIQRNTLKDPTTLAALQGFTLVKADMSDYGPDQADLMRQMAVVGPPTFVFFGKDGREVPGTRLSGAVGTASLSASAAAAMRSIAEAD